MIQPNYHGKTRISINKAIGTMIHRIGWFCTITLNHPIPNSMQNQHHKNYDTFRITASSI